MACYLLFRGLTSPRARASLPEGLRIPKRRVHTASLGTASLRIGRAGREDHSLEGNATVGGGPARGLFRRSTTLVKAYTYHMWLARGLFLAPFGC